MPFRPDLPRDVYPTDDEIGEFAYEILLERMSTSIGTTDVWMMAEAELLERAARRLFNRRRQNERDHKR
ncbi:MAG TPA: hypothetical protein VH583_25860 [Vicinamibacterales bacterium]